MTTTIWPDLPPDSTQLIIFLTMGAMGTVVSMWHFALNF